MRSAASPIRLAVAASLALLLSLRLLGSAGYMPELDHSRLTIIVCPDADLNAPLALGMGRHHHDMGKHADGICPYAAAAALGAVGPDWAPLLAGVLLAALLVLGQTLISVEPISTRDRPPAIGPPIPA